MDCRRSLNYVDWCSRSLWFNIAPMDNRFYIDRNRIYAGLVIFVFGATLFLGGLPSLRHRLGGRLVQLKQAAKGYSGPPTVEAQVGQNPEPFPAQYEKPIVVSQKPAMPMIVIGPQGVPQVVPSQRTQEVVEPPAFAKGKPRRSIRIPTTVPGQSDSEAAGQPSQPARSDQQAADTDASLEPVFKQGEIEREAYNLVLGKYTTVSGMVTGNSPNLHFKTWAAAKRDEDTYWVRLLFDQSPDKTEVSYIWEVRVSAKQVTPLNYNARSLPRS